MSVVELTEAVAVLGSFPALAGASITIDEGDIVLLRGPNGAGKTTLLRLCAGLVPIVRGTGHILGFDLATQREAIRQHVGVLGHQNGLYLDLTVGENIRFWGATVGASHAETHAAMERLGVADRLVDVPVRKLSAGQKRRTALACLVATAGAVVAARRTACRPRCCRPRRTRRHPSSGGGCGGHDRGREPRTRARRVVGHPCCRRHRRSRPRVSSILGGGLVSVWRIARLVALKDLRIEWHSRVLTNQVLPFAGVTMVIFAFALDSDAVLERVAPGLVWLATLFSMLVLVQRSFAIETDDGALDALRVAGVDPRAIFLGKASGLAVQLLVLEVVLVFAAVVLYRQTVPLGGLVLLVTTLISATCGLAAVGTLYGGLAAGFRGRETLLPLLTLPAVAPVLIGATRAVEAALGTAGAVVSDGWPWVGLLAVFAVAFGVGGSLAFGPLIDE